MRTDVFAAKVPGCLRFSIEIEDGIVSIIACEAMSFVGSNDGYLDLSEFSTMLDFERMIQGYENFEEMMTMWLYIRFDSVAEKESKPFE